MSTGSSRSSDPVDTIQTESGKLKPVTCFRQRDEDSIEIDFAEVYPREVCCDTRPGWNRVRLRFITACSCASSPDFRLPSFTLHFSCLLFYFFVGLFCFAFQQLGRRSIPIR